MPVVSICGKPFMCNVRVTVLAEDCALTHPPGTATESIILYVYVPAAKPTGVKVDPTPVYTMVLPLYHTAVYVPEFAVKDTGEPKQYELLVVVGAVNTGGVGNGFTTSVSVNVLAEAGAFIQPPTIAIESITLKV